MASHAQAMGFIKRINPVLPVPQQPLAACSSIGHRPF